MADVKGKARWVKNKDDLRLVLLKLLSALFSLYALMLIWRFVKSAVQPFYEAPIEGTGGSTVFVGFILIFILILVLVTLGTFLGKGSDEKRRLRIILLKLLGISAVVSLLGVGNTVIFDDPNIFALFVSSVVMIVGLVSFVILGVLILGTFLGESDKKRRVREQREVCQQRELQEATQDMKAMDDDVYRGRTH